MATKEIKYANGADGYNAMVADFKEMFGWDEIESNEESNKSTIFKKSCGNDAYVGARISLDTTKGPIINLIANNGISQFTIPST